MNSTITKEDIRARLIGAWRLTSWTVKDDNGNEINYFGNNPHGILIYSEQGYMSAHIAKAKRKKHISNGLYDSHPEEITASFNSYFGYYGRFYLENENTIVHEVEDAQFPNWKGDLQRRFFKMEGADLEVTTPPIETEGKTIVHYVKWKKAGS